MNDKCAAGTGRFLEMVSRNLEIDIDQMSGLHKLSQDRTLTVNSTCAVFAESEIISLLAEGHKKEEFMRDFVVPEAPQITTAIGAAHMALDMCNKSRRNYSTSPRGQFI